jgi:hypothetical protein
VYYSGGERAENVVAIVVSKSILRSVVKKNVYNDRIIAIKLQAELINILMMQVYCTCQHRIMEMMKWNSYMT